MCNYFRNCDRKINKYPELTFPLNYLMKGGYKDFHKSFKYFCTKENNFGSQKNKDMNKTDTNKFFSPQNKKNIQPKLKNGKASFENLKTRKKIQETKVNKIEENVLIDVKLQNFIKSLLIKKNQSSIENNSRKKSNPKNLECRFKKIILMALKIFII